MRRIGPAAIVAILTALVAACGSAGGSTGPSGAAVERPPSSPTSMPIATGPVSSGPADAPGATPSALPTPIPSGPEAFEGLIAYVRGPEGAREVHVVAPDGTGDRSCGTGSAPSWSADGSTIVFAGPLAPTEFQFEFPDIYRAGSDCAGVTKVLAEGTAPHLSPDGQWLTFGRGIIDTGDAWIAKADGSEPRLLAAGTSPTWSPDGAWLLFQPGGAIVQIGLIRPDGTDGRVLGGGGSPSWTPDGRILYLQFDDATATTTLRLASVDGARTDLLSTPGDLGTPVMTADGVVVFAWDGDLWRLRPGSTLASRLTEGLSIASPPTLSADGRWIAVAAGGTAPGLAVVSIDGGWVQVLDGIVSDVAWQPVGPVE